MYLKIRECFFFSTEEETNFPVAKAFEVNTKNSTSTAVKKSDIWLLQNGLRFTVKTNI